EPLETGKRRDGLGDLWVVLHAAGPQRIEPGVDAVVPLGQRGEVANHVDLGHPRKGRVSGPTVLGRRFRPGDVQLGEAPGPPARLRPLLERPGGDARPLGSNGCAGPHEAASSKAFTNRSISSRVLRSVTEISKAPSSMTGPARNPASTSRDWTTAASCAGRTANSLNTSASGHAR